MRLVGQVTKSFRRLGRGMGVTMTGHRQLCVVFTAIALFAIGSGLSATGASAEVVHNFEFSFDGSEVPGGPFEGDLSTVAVDQASGDVYVMEYQRAVERFDAAGKYLGEITGAAVPQGSLGSFYSRSGVAVDNSGGLNNGDLYVAGTENDVVYRFDSSGKLLGEITGAGTPAGAGSFRPAGVAVGASGEVYVADLANDVVDEFNASGAYIGQVASLEILEPASIAVDSSGNVYVTNFAMDVVKLEPGGGSSILDANKATAVAVDSATGHVFVNENNYPAPGRIVEFDQTGKRLGSFGEEEISSNVNGLAVNGATGEVYAADNYDKLVDVFGPGLVIPDTTTGAGSSAEPSSVMLNGMVDPDGLPVSSCKFEYGPSTSYVQSVPCEQSLLSIGSGSSPVAVSADVTGLQPDSGYHFRLAAANSNGTNHGEDMAFTTTGPPRIDGESATGLARTTVTLQAQINPFGFDTTYHLEYDTKEYKEGEVPHGTSVPVPSADIGSGIGDVAVSQEVSGLQSGVTYHYRAVATNAQGIADGPDQTVTTIPPAYIDAEYTTGVTSSSATLSTEVNPIGTDSEYRLEYGPDASYGNTISGSTGVASTDVPIAYHVQELQPGSTYHYRIVVHNAFGTVEGIDRTFTTQVGGGVEFTLPDGRAWELVSPAQTGGALIGVLDNPPLNPEAATDGSAIAYQVNAPIGEGAMGRVGSSQIISRHGSHGWASRDITAPRTLPPPGESATATVGVEHFYLFSPDLSQAAFEPAGPYSPQLPGVTERTIMLRNNVSETYAPLVTQANVPPGTKIAGEEGSNSFEQMNLEAVTPDFGHVFLRSNIALTPDAPAGPASSDLYEWSAGRLQFVGQGKVGNGGKSSRQG